jgi:hypothetical protein
MKFNDVFSLCNLFSKRLEYNPSPTNKICVNCKILTKILKPVKHVMNFYTKNRLLEKDFAAVEEALKFVHSRRSKYLSVQLISLKYA